MLLLAAVTVQLQQKGYNTNTDKLAVWAKHLIKQESSGPMVCSAQRKEGKECGGIWVQLVTWLSGFSGWHRRLKYDTERWENRA